MDVLLISGFLGAGKTSFIKAMTKATGRQFVVVENEFGEANIDGSLLRGDSAPGDPNEMKIWELTEGCICCSMNIDFSLSVLTIENTLRPDYLLVEPSGVAMPSRVLDSLRKVNYEHIGILSPITIVDAAHFRRSRNDYAEYFDDQLRSAGTVVLSKSEDMSADDFDAAARELNIAPNVIFPREHYSKWPKESWTALLSRRLEGTRAPAAARAKIKPERPLDNAAFRVGDMSSPAELLVKIELLISGAFGRVVRSKGFVRTAFGEWLRFDVVDGMYEITGSPQPTSADGKALTEGEIVVIGENLSEDRMDELFEVRADK